MKVLKEVVSADGKSKLAIYGRPDGLVSFEETAERWEEGSETTFESFSYWVPTHVSGLYRSAEAAERDAISMTPWLRPPKD
jgi:hypothetical protein